MGMVLVALGSACTPPPNEPAPADDSAVQDTAADLPFAILSPEDGFALGDDGDSDRATDVAVRFRTGPVVGVVSWTLNGMSTDDCRTEVPEGGSQVFACDVYTWYEHPRICAVHDEEVLDCVEGTVCHEDRWYPTDADGDGYGVGTPTFGCDPGTGAVDGGEDCDDDDASIHPDATEVCLDGVDSDCTGADECGGVDGAEAVLEATNGAAGAALAVADLDGDSVDELIVGTPGTSAYGVVPHPDEISTATAPRTSSPALLDRWAEPASSWDRSPQATST